MKQINSIRQKEVICPYCGAIVLDKNCDEYHGVCQCCDQEFNLTIETLFTTEVIKE